MIVKNEREIITKSLASVLNLIDYWVIVDTGSSDGTQEVIKEFLKGIPGELHQRPWVDFAHNRNEALHLAKNKGDYVLFMDADEELVFSHDFKWPELSKDCYSFLIRQAGKGVDYHRILLINNHLFWYWEGVVHETIKSDVRKEGAMMPNVFALSHTYGDRSKDPQKYLKDAQLLEKALEKDPQNARYVYYLAQSYLNVPDLPKALKYYQQRAEMGGWDQEVFFSKYCVGMLQAELKYPSESIIQNLTEAYLLRPTRAEPLYRMSQHYLQNKNYLSAYLVVKQALSIPVPTDTIFVERWIYEWGLLLQAAEASYFLGKFSETKQLLELLLQIEDFPQEIKKNMKNNLEMIKQLL